MIFLSMKRLHITVSLPTFYLSPSCFTFNRPLSLPHTPLYAYTRLRATLNPNQILKESASTKHPFVSSRPKLPLRPPQPKPSPSHQTIPPAPPPKPTSRPHNSKHPTNSLQSPAHRSKIEHCLIKTERSISLKKTITHCISIPNFCGTPLASVSSTRRGSKTPQTATK